MTLMMFIETTVDNCWFYLLLMDMLPWTRKRSSVIAVESVLTILIAFWFLLW